LPESVSPGDGLDATDHEAKGDCPACSREAHEGGGNDHRKMSTASQCEVFSEGAD
jgi:hypothetical protein